jgi:hypothetical protein
MLLPFIRGLFNDDDKYRRAVNLKTSGLYRLWPKFRYAKCLWIDLGRPRKASLSQRHAALIFQWSGMQDTNPVPHEHTQERHPATSVV